MSQPPSVTWHSRPVSSIFQELAADESGLSQREAEKRLAESGSNSLPRKPPLAWWQILLRQFRSPLIYILVAAAIVSVLAGDANDALFIGIVLGLNALFGGYQEWKAERSNRALQKLLHARATVVRDGEAREIDAERIVAGDMVWLESGNRVPADMRLLWTSSALIDESLLTGESVAVSKSGDWIGAEDTPVADRRNVAYAASIVVRGRAKGIVVATGANTEIGRLAVDVLSESGGESPLLERMEAFSRSIAYVVVAAVAIVSTLGVVVQGRGAHEMFLFGVALAVSAIPEGLPAVLTVALAVATTRMSRRGVIVRRLAAVEGLGSCTLIASDKTGTLTCNELTVRVIRLPNGDELSVLGEGFIPNGEVMAKDRVVKASDDPALEALARVALLCNEGDLRSRDDKWTWHGDPTDVALLSLGRKLGLRRDEPLAELPQIHAIPFESEQQFAATYHRDGDGARVAVKGAPERVLAMCRRDAEGHAARVHSRAAEELAAKGYRVLALAEGHVSNPPNEGETPTIENLEFRGFAGMIDPLRPGVQEAVARCQAAGITVCMVTGDHPVTALAIARELGLANDAAQVVSGGDLTNKSQDEFRAALRSGRVFARVAPRQKLELVEAARAEGHFVAVTGDGVNDAPALRAANIGVAMGKSGTDVAREAAELVITDDNFSTIVSGVEEGRVAYDNVRKVIFLLVSAGAAEVLLIGAAFAFGSSLPLPFLPVQLLWLNLVTDGIQGIALAFEPGEHGILRRKPRPPREPIFDRLMLERTLVAACTMAVVGIVAFQWMVRHGWSDDSARNALLLLMVLFENVHLANCRSETTSATRQSPFRGPFLLAGAAVALVVHVIAMYVPFLRSVLRTEPVSLATWGVLVALSLSVLVTMEIQKWTWNRRHAATPSSV